MSAAPASNRLRLAYGVGAVAFGVKDNGFSYLLLLYYDQVLGLPATLAGLAIFLALVVDSVWDPMVGYFSDHLRTRWGRRHPLMYGAALPVAASYFLLWNPPAGLGQGALFAWLLCVSIGVRMLITLYETPSTALVAELTEDYDERTRLLSLRYMFGWWGGLGVAVLAYQVFLPAGGGQLAAPGYRYYGMAASLIMFVSMLVSALGTHGQIPRLKQPPAMQAASLGTALRELIETLSNRSFLSLFAGAITYAAAAGLAASLSIYIYTFVWELDSTHIGYLNWPYFGSALVAAALAPALARAIGKKRAAITTSIAALLMAPLPLALRLLGWFPDNGSEALFWTLMFFYPLEVVLIVMSTALVSAMVADVVEESELATGRRSEGVFFAARSFAHKSVSGFGLFLATILLGVVGFPEGAASPSDVEPAVIRRLAGIYIAFIVLAYGLSIAFYARYRINRAGHEDNLRKLAERAPARA